MTSKVSEVHIRLFYCKKISQLKRNNVCRSSRIISRIKLKISDYKIATMKYISTSKIFNTHIQQLFFNHIISIWNDLPFNTNSIVYFVPKNRVERRISNLFNVQM